MNKYFKWNIEEIIILTGKNYNTVSKIVILL